jgi:hypothetical protein
LNRTKEPLDTSLEGGERYFNFCTPGIKFGFEISDKEKATREQGEGGRVLKKSKKKKLLGVTSRHLATSFPNYGLMAD